ncbi:UDP-glycosyltransferase UGT5-like [Zerene cesonia]|uniref:UDP-glycosyltransferase UGT5-like n=1 Tax=Zerene cesonia TaxID=33412 RepID=UPI0018E596EC|nr:UDP-glycosyltransferase UGT5-like [Zerene cesonia]
MWRTINIILTICVLFCSFVNSSRILAVFPMPSISHQLAFRPLIHELAKRGHEVVVITPDPAFPKGKAPTNLTEIDVHDISYEIWQEMFNSHTGDKDDVLQNIVLMFKLITKTFEKQIQTPEVQKLMKEDYDKFDIVLIEACVRPTIALSHIFKAPLVMVSSFGAVPAQYDLFGAPMHPLLYPSTGRVRVYNLTLWEKAKELFISVFLQRLISTTEENDYQMMKRNFGDDLPSLEELFKNADMLMLNEHHIWADNHPVAPNIVYIGGMHYRPESELPKDIKQFLDSSKHGTIYISFGTNIIPSILPRESIQAMVNVLTRLPYDVLWKWDDDNVPTQAKNIKFSKWFPQSDLLRHPNIKLFITQGGLQSTDEAINSAVPLIGLPMLGDQWYNVEKYVRFNFGKQLDIMALSENEFRDAVVAVIENPSYKANVIKLRDLMREHPVKPLDLAVWSIEHVMKHGAKHLRPPTFGGMSAFEYYEVPLILFLLGILAAILLAVIIVIVLIIH